MADVICLVEFTETMRDRISFKLAISIHNSLFLIKPALPV